MQYLGLYKLLKAMQNKNTFIGLQATYTNANTKILLQQLGRIRAAVSDFVVELRDILCAL